MLELASAMAAPLTCQLLGDLGADVLKIEPPTGDGYRGRLMESDADAPGINPRFACVNRNKRSLAIDIHNPEARAIVDRLIKWADVLIINYRMGTPERLGWGAERCHELNPRLIYARLTGYGDSGPWARRRGADIWTQAVGGTVAPQGSPGREPILGSTAFVDHGTPLALAYGITAALYDREKTGKGTVVKTSLLDTTLYMQTSSNLTDYLNGEPMVVKGGRGWGGGFPMGAYPASDGDLVTMMIGDDQWDAFLRVLGLDHMRGRPEYDTQAKRVALRHDLYPILDEAFRKKTRAEWAKIFKDTGIIRAEPALRYDEVAAHPQVQHNETIIPVPHSEVGAFMAIASPVSVGGTRSDIRLPPPGVGEHTGEILGELGFAPAEVEAMFTGQVVFDPAHPATANAKVAQREKYAKDLAGAVADEG